MHYAFGTNYTNYSEKKAVFEKYYLEGYLYGIFKNNKVICGNYAALVSTLADRAGINCILVASYNHAWNMIEINGKDYFVDMTKIDNLYNEGSYAYFDEDYNIIFSNGNSRQKDYLIDLNNCDSDNYDYINIQELLKLKERKQIMDLIIKLYYGAMVLSIPILSLVNNDKNKEKKYKARKLMK